MSYMITVGVCCGATGLWQMFSERKLRRPSVTFAELSLCVSPPCMSCPDPISQLCSACCPRCTACLLHCHLFVFFSFHLSLSLSLSLSACLFKRERNAAGLMQRQTLWLWLSACGCERMIKEPAINMTVWWWGCLPICCFIWRLMTSSWRDDLSRISGGQCLRTPLSQPYPDITFFKYAEHG